MVPDIGDIAWIEFDPVPAGLKTRGAVLVDQVRAIERVERMFDIIERAPVELRSEIRGKLAALLGFDVVSPLVDS